MFKGCRGHRAEVGQVGGERHEVESPSTRISSGLRRDDSIENCRRPQPANRKTNHRIGRGNFLSLWRHCPGNLS